MPRSDHTIDAATLRWFRESASGGIVTTDAALHIVGWNRWLVAVTGITEENAVGRPLLTVLPSFVERGFDQYYNDALNGYIPADMSLEMRTAESHHAAARIALAKSKAAASGE